jgi:hypothetical protein
MDGRFEQRPRITVLYLTRYEDASRTTRLEALECGMRGFERVFDIAG